MIVTELYDGQGFGNQLFCYVVTRVIATDKGLEFGIGSPQKFKGHDFLRIDFGKKVVGGSGPEGGPPHELPEGIHHYYNERKITHPSNGADLRTFDQDLVDVPDATKLDGIMQDEHYILHRKDEIRKWLQVKEDCECYDYADDDTCVINFRGGEYVHFKDLFLTQKYWDDAIAHMRKINKNMTFVVITDDVHTAKKFFPSFAVHHFSIGKDYVVIKNAHYLILSNSSFACFPAWLNENLKFCIAPKYWARHNISDGFWSCSYNLFTGWMYMDRNGTLFDHAACRKELDTLIATNSQLFEQKKITENFLVISQHNNDLSWVPRYTDNYVIYDSSTSPIYPPKLLKKHVVRSTQPENAIRDYISYIIDHYEKLPKRVIFATGNLIPRYISREFFDRVLNNAFFTPLEDFKKYKEDWPNSYISPDGGFCEINTSWYLNLNEYYPTKYFHTYNHFLEFLFKDAVIPRYIRFAPGANYIVPRENILKYPKVFYQNLLTFVSHSDSATPGEAQIIERALYTIWNCNYKINDAMLQAIGDDFVAKPKSKPTLQERFVGKSRQIRSNALTAGMSLARKTVRKAKHLVQNHS